MKTRSKATVAVAAVALIATTSLPAFAAEAPAYVQAVANGASLKVLATAGDVIDGYQIAGIPDGTGAFKSGNSVKILMNHEIGYSSTSASMARAGGDAYGATVTEFTMNPTTQKLTTAREFLTSALFYNYATKTYSSTPAAPAGATEKDSYGTPQHTKFLNRFCSASLAPAGRFSFVVPKTQKAYGIKDAVFLTGEEGGDESRGFAVNAAGQLAQIPGLGLASWETFVAAPTGTKTTALFGNEDGSATDSQLWLYQGSKTNTGTWFQRAGLANGKTYVMNIGGFKTEADFRAQVGKGKETSVSFAAVDATVNGVAQNKAAALVGTSLARVEDGAFDPNDARNYYFVTTESNGDKAATALDPNNKLVTKRDGGALWKLRLTDAKNPALGGKITMLLDGSEAPYMNKPDNIEVDGYGNILIQEDPGNNPQIERMFAYRIADGKIAIVSQFNDKMFSKTAADASFITEDEEQSGVVNVTSLLRKNKTDKNFYYVLNAQVHATGAALLKARPDITNADEQTVLARAIEAGQVYLLTIADWSAVYGK